MSGRGKFLEHWGVRLQACGIFPPEQHVFPVVSWLCPLLQSVSAGFLLNALLIWPESIHADQEPFHPLTTGGPRRRRMACECRPAETGAFHARQGNGSCAVGDSAYLSMGSTKATHAPDPSQDGSPQRHRGLDDDA